MRVRISLLLVSILSIGVLQFAVAQQITGNLEGRAVDDSGQPLNGANVVVRGPALQGTRGEATNDEGYFRLPALPVGAHTVEIRYVGFHPLVLEAVVIRLGKTTSLDELSMYPETVDLDGIEVIAGRLPIDPTTTTTGANLDYETINPLPVDRSFRSIAALVPQVNTSYFGDEVNVAGSTGLENVYFIDGVNVTDPYRARTSTNLPYNFIKEIEIKTGGYEPEYRSALGGIMNVVTQSGGNEVQGQAFGFFTNQSLSRTRRLASGEARIGDFSSTDFGVSLGGPIVKDRLWYFAAYNPTFEREEIEVPGFGFHTDEKTTHIFAGKLTWRAGESTHGTLSVFGDPNTYTRIGPSNDGLPAPNSVENIDPFLGQWDEGGVNASAKLTHILNQNAFLEFDLSYMRRYEKNLAGTEIGNNEPLFIDIGNGTWSGGYGVFADNKNQRLYGGASISLLKGAHEFKAGFSVEESRQLRGRWAADVIFKISDTFYQTITNDQVIGNATAHVPSLFAQDAWRISERLQLNYGLRWDGVFIIGSDKKLAQTITDQLQPRIGLIYQPSEGGKQKIFGSYGRFYEHLPMLFSRRFSESFEVIAFFDRDPRIDPSGGNETPSSGLSPIPESVKELEGQYVDEFSFGYESRFLEYFKFSSRVVYKTLKQVVDDGFTPEDGFIIGNPGKGELDFLPAHTRNYKALELALSNYDAEALNFAASYILSQNKGNYAGLFNAENGLGPIPHWNRTLDIPEQVPNSTGLLPNDRTHVLKFNGSYRFHFPLTVGTFLIWQSGTPISELGGTTNGLPWYSFVSKRGSSGRTSAIWDWNVRLTYDMGRSKEVVRKTRIILDLRHIGNFRKEVNVDQIHYTGLTEEGRQTGENPNYLMPIAYQPPMSVRLGIEVSF